MFCRSYMYIGNVLTGTLSGRNPALAALRIRCRDSTSGDSFSPGRELCRAGLMLPDIVSCESYHSLGSFTVLKNCMIRTLTFFYIRYPARLRHQLFRGPGDQKYELAPFSLKTRICNITKDVKIYIYI
jgi:hypothetical protein